MKREDKLVWLKEIIPSNHPIIKSVGKGSYYAGHYDLENHSFDENILYADMAQINGETITIGNYCCIGSGVKFIMGGNQGHPNGISQHPLFQHDEPFKFRTLESKGDITIGNDVWIGYNAEIMPGITIGNGARIGARALVTKNVEPYNIVAGLPAKKIGQRFNEEKIEILEQIKWWNWPDKIIKENVELLTNKNHDFDKLLEVYEQINDYQKEKNIAKDQDLTLQSNLQKYFPNLYCNHR